MLAEPDVPEIKMHLHAQCPFGHFQVDPQESAGPTRCWPSGSFQGKSAS